MKKILIKNEFSDKNAQKTGKNRVKKVRVWKFLAPSSQVRQKK